MGKFLILGMLAFFLLYPVSEANPAQYYVGPNGKDSDTGDRSHPFKSIARGISAASAGDSVVLMPGKYPGVITIAKSGVPEKPITIISDSHDEEQFAVIDGGYPEGWDEYFEKPGMPTKGSKNYGIVIGFSGSPDFAIVMTPGYLPGINTTLSPALAVEMPLAMDLKG